MRFTLISVEEIIFEQYQKKRRNNNAFVWIKRKGKHSGGHEYWHNWKINIF